MYSLLQKKPILQTDPYPHVIIEDALPWDVYEELERTFPENAILSPPPGDQKCNFWVTSAPNELH